jgi:hypothetical protein
LEVAEDVVAKVTITKTEEVAEVAGVAGGVAEAAEAGLVVVDSIQ